MNIQSTQIAFRKPILAGPAKPECSDFKAAGSSELEGLDGYVKSQQRGNGDLGDMGMNMMLGAAGGGVAGLLVGSVVANSFGMGSIGLVGMALAGGAVGGVGGLTLGAVLT
jgi:hypothetical protein